MIKKIRLQNWKSHAESEYSFTNGTNVLVGAMGAGKSSVLQAISFALFGTFSELKRKELKISDLVNRNSEIKNALIDLEIQNGNNILEIKRIIEDGNTKEAVIRNSEGRLIAGTNPAQVNAYLKDTLKIDEDIFLRTIYAKQNEIDLFLQLTPIERKTRLDQLMNIDKFETARKNCVKLINQLDAKKASHEEFIKDFRIEELERAIADLKSDCERLLAEKTNLLVKVSEVEKDKQELDSRIALLRKNIEDFQRAEEKKKILEQQLNDLKEKLGSISIDEDLQSVSFRLREIKTKIVELQRSKMYLKEDLERQQKNALENERRLGILEQKSSELAEALAEISKLRHSLDELEKGGNLLFLEGRLQALGENFDKTIDERSRLAGEISVLREHLAELEATQGICPVCSAELTAEKKSELVLQRRQKISELEGRAHSLDEMAAAFRQDLEKAKELHEKQQDIVKKIEKMEDLLREEREIAIQFSQASGKKETFSEVIAQMQERLNSTDIEIAELDSELTQLTEKRHLCELRERENTIVAELEMLGRMLAEKTFQPGEMSELEQKHENTIRLAQELASKADSCALVIEEKQKRLADFEDKQKRYFEIKDKIQIFKDKNEFLQQFKNALLTAQETLRKELILAVNEVMSSLWSQLYPYDKWTSVKLDASEDDYVLKIKEKEGYWISVAGFASGGERMLACLVLRLAFAKVLAQNLNMLILDEPTHNLDDKAISTLVDVIQNRLSGFLEQLFIVTHDEKLAEAGDNIIRIT